MSSDHLFVTIVQYYSDRDLFWFRENQQNRPRCWQNNEKYALNYLFIRLKFSNKTKTDVCCLEFFDEKIFVKQTTVWLHSLGELHQQANIIFTVNELRGHAHFVARMSFCVTRRLSWSEREQLGRMGKWKQVILLCSVARYCVTQHAAAVGWLNRHSNQAKPENAGKTVQNFCLMCLAACVWSGRRPCALLSCGLAPVKLFCALGLRLSLPRRRTLIAM